MKQEAKLKFLLQYVGHKFLFESADQLRFKLQPESWILIDDIGILYENLRNGWFSVDFLGFLTNDKVLLIQRKGDGEVAILFSIMVLNMDSNDYVCTAVVNNLPA